MKILLDHNPLAPSNVAPADFGALFRSRPAWITASQPQTPPDVTAYRLQVDLPQAATIRVHVSAVHLLQPAMLPAQLAVPRRAGRVRFVAATAWADPQVIAVDG